MPLLSLPELRATLGRNQRLIGIDPGQRTIGVALSDVLLTLVVALWRDLGAASCERTTRSRSMAIARQQDAGGLVVGLPLSMDGSFGPSAQAARDWALALSDACNRPADCAVG